MEMLKDNTEKRTILLLLQDGDGARTFCANLEQDFIPVRSGTAEECLRVMTERYADLSAVIVDADLAVEDDCAFLKAAASKEHFATIPVLAVAKSWTEPLENLCLAEGVVDFIIPPYRRGLVKQRIENAVNLKRSTTFVEIERILRELPVTIYLKDSEGRYVFATHYYDLRVGDDPNWTISGKTDLDVRKDRENAIKAMESDAEIVRTGEGTSYVIQTGEGGSPTYIELTKMPVFDSEGNVTGIVALVKNVTEQMLIKNELEARLFTDELTGLGSRRAFDEYIEELLESGKCPVAVISADCDHLKHMNDTYGHIIGDEYLRMSTLVMKTSLPPDARAFRMGGDEFLILVPGMDREGAELLVEEMREHQELLTLEGEGVSISFGVDVLESPADDMKDIIERADHAMYEDKESHRAL